MKLSHLKPLLDAKHYQSLIGKGLDELRPPQELAIKAGLFEGKNLVVSSPTASGKCLAYDSGIQLSTGETKPIGEIVENEIKKKGFNHKKGIFAVPANLKIITLNDKLKTEAVNVSQCWKLKAPKEMIKVNFANGRQLIVTKEHPFLIFKDGLFKWTQSKDLKQKEKVASARFFDVVKKEDSIDFKKMLNKLPIVYVNNINKEFSLVTGALKKQGYTYRSIATDLGVDEKDIYRWRVRTAVPLEKLKLLFNLADRRYEHLIKKISHQSAAIPVKLVKRYTPGLMEFLGFMIADGHVHSMKSNSFIEFTNTNKKMLLKFKKSVKNLFGLTCKYKFDGKRSPSLIVHSKIIAEMLDYFGVPSGKKSDKVYITDEIMRLDNINLKFLIRALFDCDGSIHKRGIEYGTDSKKLIYGIQSILLRFGINSIINSRYFKGKNRYRLFISSKRQMKLFQENIDFFHPIKKKKLQSVIKSILKHHANTDVTPDISLLFKKIKEELNLKNIKQLPASVESYIYGWRKNINIENAKKIIDILSNYGVSKSLDFFKTLVNSDIFWTEIKSIDIIKNKNVKWVYDLTIDKTHNFLAENIFVHNTLVAELAAFHNILTNKGKTLYIVPLKALANEKFNEFKKFYGHYTKIALSIGDFDSSDAWLHTYDLIITTSEKFDSLIRHNVPWLREIGTVIIDEVHMLDDASRGPTLEIIITRLRNFLPKAQMIALSATISNAKELADWLGAELIKSTYRPIELREGVYLNEEFDFGGKAEKIIGKSIIPEIRILEDTLAKNKSMLLFVSSRRNAEGAAKKCLATVREKLTPAEKAALQKLSSDILKALETPTKQCQDLAMCIRDGVAFHHAGLVAKQREYIEEAFRSRLIKIISATPTLAMGLNLPSFRSVIRDLKRFDLEEGMAWIPVLEFKQMSGRAGRPGLEDHGEGIAVAKTTAESDNIFDRYINGEPEEIYSKLSVEPVLRMQILGLIATSEIKDRKSLMDFFSKTFYVHQYGNLDKIENKLDKIMNELVGWGFVKPEGKKFLPTQMGKRISELYIDPYSAHLMMDSLKKSKKEPMYYLHSICQCLEMRPLLRVAPKEFSEIQQKSLEFEDILPEEPSPWDFEYEVWVKAFKTALMLNDWISETSEAVILEKYRETPGMLRNRLNNADWMLYAFSEIAHILNKKEDLLPLRKLRTRVSYGVREELLRLLKFEGIGRMRARKLYASNIKSAVDIKRIPYEKISDIIGPKTAKKLKEQVTSETQQTKLEM